MRARVDLKEPFQAAILYAVLGVLWMVLTQTLLPNSRNAEIASTIVFVIAGALLIFEATRRVVTRQHEALEELVDREEHSSQRRRRLDILWRFAGGETADFDSHAKTALEVSARVLGLESAEVGHVEDDRFVFDLFFSHEPMPGESVPLESSLAALAVEAGRVVAWTDLAEDPQTADHPRVRENGLRSYIGTPFTVGEAQYALGFWSWSTRDTPFDEEDFEYVQVLAGFFGGLLRQRKQEAEMTHLALHDPLTGLANRSNLLDRLRSSIAANRRRATRFALLVINLDRFKQVNDLLGHAAGDRVLIEASKRLSNVLRAEDSLARVGGDEFGVITSLMKSPDEVV